MWYYSSIITLLFLFIAIYFYIKKKRYISNDSNIPIDSGLIARGKYNYMVTISCIDSIVYVHSNTKFGDKEVDELKHKLVNDLELPQDKVDEIGVTFLGKSK